MLGYSVHPRVCGERGGDCINDRASGSSPRVRGTHRAATRAITRFIPACAGNAGGAFEPIAPVHPRVCGERSGGAEVDFSTGSSPRVRGTRRGRARCTGDVGSSPRVRGTLGQQSPIANATVHPRVCGERICPSCDQASSPVHPRVCGERPATLAFAHWPSGSSPRVRGTRGYVSRFSLLAVHPRVCGERAASRFDRQHQYRFIPACAGNAGEFSQSLCGGSSPRVRGTPPVRCSNVRSAVHPRVCGERQRKRPTIVFSAGSSPRVRGTPDASRRGTCDGSSPRVRGTPAHARRAHERFIPACAGNAAGECHGCHAIAVHPRVCGERMTCHMVGSANLGSSPRVRGTRVYECPCDRQARFIPACAGNASARLLTSAFRAVHPRVCGERASAPIDSSRRPVHPRVCGER